MKVMNGLLVVLALSTGCSAALRRTAQASEVVTHVSLACDGLSTRTALRDGRYYETNPMIAGNPSDGALAGYFGFVDGSVFMGNRMAGSLLAGHTKVASLLRLGMNLAVLGVEVDSVQHNREAGVATCGL